MKTWSVFIVFLVASAPALSADYQLLTDSQLGDVTGKEGIAVTLEVAINATVSGNVVSSSPAVHCPGAVDCRLAVQFNDRSAWLVMKEYYGFFRLNSLWVDVVSTPSTWTVYSANGASPNPYLQGFDPRNKPSVQLSYDHSALGGNQAYYGDAVYYLSVGRVTAEFGASGYANNAVTGSAIGLRVADGPNGVNGAAQIRFDGNMKLLGY